jgi:hypothetical protein
VKAPTGKRERILGFGRSGSGKSSMWGAIGEWEADTGGGGKVWVADSDNAWDAMWSENSEGVVQAERVRGYVEAVHWARGIRGKVKGDDWVVMDMADKVWSWSQEHYWQTVTGEDDLLLGDVYVQDQLARKKAEVVKGGGKWEGDDGEAMAGAHGANWGVIYKYYHGLLNMVLNLPCHVLFVAGAREIRPDTKPAIVAQYKGCGFYPAGPPNENELAHNFHSVIFCAETPRDWVYTTVKERGPIRQPSRRMMMGEKVEDFVVSYLMGVAGWKMA